MAGVAYVFPERTSKLRHLFTARGGLLHNTYSVQSNTIGHSYHVPSRVSTDKTPSSLTLETFENNHYVATSWDCIIGCEHFYFPSKSIFDLLYVWSSSSENRIKQYGAALLQHASGIIIGLFVCPRSTASTWTIITTATGAPYVVIRTNRIHRKPILEKCYLVRLVAYFMSSPHEELDISPITCLRRLLISQPPSTTAMQNNPKADIRPSFNRLRKGGAGEWRNVFTMWGTRSVSTTFTVGR